MCFVIVTTTMTTTTTTTTRYLLDNRHVLLNKNVLDVGSGCGASAIAASMCGANRVMANDICHGTECLYFHVCACASYIFLQTHTHTHTPTHMGARAILFQSHVKCQRKIV